MFSASLICFSKPGREGRLVLVEEKEGDRSGKERRNWECYGAPVQSGVTDGAVLEQGGSKHDDQRQSPEYGHKTTVEHTQTLIFLPFSQPSLLQILQCDKQQPAHDQHLSLAQLKNQSQRMIKVQQVRRSPSVLSVVCAHRQTSRGSRS